MKIKSNLWIENQQSGYFGKGRIELLQNIDKYGSISKAAKEMKMSYKAAWDAVNEMNTLNNESIVVRETGGKGGGGTILTNKGKEYIKVFQELQKIQEKFFNLLSDNSDTLKSLINASKHITLQTSARNQYTGTVTSIKSSSVEFDVELDIGNNEKIYSLITQTSAKKMNIEIGSTIFALIKSNWVMIKNNKSATKKHNYLHGNIIEIKDDKKFTEITLSLKSKNIITAVITSKSFNSLSLKIGDLVYAFFKPSDVLLAR